jgi:hypothetical protein
MSIMGVSRRFGGLLAVSLVAVSLLAPGCSGDDTAPSTPHQVAENTVGMGGGQVTSNGVKLTIPAGALDHDVTITVATSSDPTPTGYVALSPVFVFGPDGLTFAKPITVTMAFTDDGRPATAFWSTASRAGFDDVGGTATGGQMTAQVTHFSQGFVGRQQYEDAGGGDSAVDSGQDGVAIDSTAGADGQSVDSGGGVDSSSGADASDASSSSDSAAPDSSTVDGSVDAGGVDSGVTCTCSVTTTCCLGQCVDTKNSQTNCGGCGISCGSGGTCSNGLCPNCANLGQQCAGTCCQGLVCGNGICQYGGAT